MRFHEFSSVVNVYLSVVIMAVLTFAMQTYLMEKHLTVKRSRGDGHCLLYTVVSSWKAQLPCAPPENNNAEGLQVGSSDDSFWSTMSLEDLRIAIQRLMKENNDLKNTMLENNTAMEEQCELLQQWKDRQEQERSSIMQRFSQARELVLELQHQKQELEARCKGLSISSPSVAGAINAELQGLKLQLEELKRENMLLSDSRNLAENIAKDLSAEVELLKQQRDSHYKSEAPEVPTADHIPAIMSLNEQQQEIKNLLKKCSHHLEREAPDAESLQQLTENINKTNQQLDAVKAQIEEDYRKVLEENGHLKGIISEKDTCITRLSKNNEMLQKEKQQLTAMNNALQTQLHILQRNSPNREESASITLFDIRKEGQTNVVTETGTQGNGNFEMASMPDEYVNVVKKDTSNDEPAVDTEVVQKSTPKEAAAPDARKQERQEKMEKTMSDLLMQLTEERAKLSKTQAQLHEQSTQQEKLKKEMDMKDHVISDLEAKLANTIDQLNLEHQLKLNQLVSKMDSMAKELNQAKGQQLQIDDFHHMKSQVMSLVNELQETEKRCEGMSVALKAEKERSLALQTKLTIFQEEKDAQRQKDDALICNLRQAIQNLEGAVQSERMEKEIHKKSLQELRKTYDRICAEYQDLLDNVDRYRERQRQHASTPSKEQSKETREKIDNLMAQLLAAEEALGSRNDKIRKLEQAMQTLKAENENIAVLKAQAEVYKTDFEAERRNREEAMSSMNRHKEEIANLQRQNQQLRDELEASNHKQIMEMQRQHAASFRPEFSNRFPQMYHQPPTLPPMQYPDPYISRQSYGNPGQTYAEQMSQQETFDERLAPRQPTIPRQANMPAIQHPPVVGPIHAQATQVEGQKQPGENPQNQDVAEEEDYTCPKCAEVYPDLDSLNLHVHRCLELDSFPQR